MHAPTSRSSLAVSVRREAWMLLAGVAALLATGVLGVGAIWLLDLASPESLSPVERLHATLWIAGLVTVVMSVVVTSATTNWERRSMISRRMQRTTEALVLLLLTVVTFTIWYFWIDYRARHGEDTSHVWVTGYLVLSAWGMLVLLWRRRWRAGFGIGGWYWLSSLACIAATVAAFYIVAALLVIGAMLLGLTSIWGGAPGVDATIFAVAIVAHLAMIALLLRVADALNGSLPLHRRRSKSSDSRPD